MIDIIYMVVAVTFALYIYDENAKALSILSGMLWPFAIVIGAIVIHTDPMARAAWEHFKDNWRG